MRERARLLTLHNGNQARPTFSAPEMERRIGNLRAHLAGESIDAARLTSIHEDVETVLEPGMVVSMEPMITIPEGLPGAGGYREHDVLIVGEDGAENVTGFPFGPEHNVIRRGVPAA